MISWIVILITSLSTISTVYTSEYSEDNYFKREYLFYDRAHNQIFRRGVPVQLDPTLETEFRHYRSEKLKTYIGTQPRSIHENILNEFINQTALDWLDENLKGLREEPEDELNYMRTREFDSVQFEYSCTPIFLIFSNKTYKIKNIEQLTLKQRDGSFLVSIPRTEHPRHQLAYCEDGKLTTYSDIKIPSTAGPIRLIVPNTPPRLSKRAQCSIPFKGDIIFLGDWIITNEEFCPRYTPEDTPAPDPSLTAHIPESLKKRLLKDLFDNFKKAMDPVVKTRKTVKSLWREDNPSTSMPKTLEAIQVADTENRLLRRVFSHPTLSNDIGFKGTSKRLADLTWQYVLARCGNIEHLKTSLMISDTNEVTSWQDIFDLGTSLGFPEAPIIIIKSLLGEAASAS
ncbi:MAG: hypothetical protein K2W94_03405 [Alphaproteobacteria bacterium]|nr:hypothetical protein [Alphaproteobacteria bacterium]